MATWKEPPGPTQSDPRALTNQGQSLSMSKSSLSTGEHTVKQKMQNSDILLLWGLNVM